MEDNNQAIKIHQSPHILSGLILSIITIVTYFLAIFVNYIFAFPSVFLGVLGVLYTILGIVEAETSEAKKVGILGFIISCVGVVLSLILVYLMLEQQPSPYEVAVPIAML